MKQLPLFFLIIFTLESSAREINEVTFSYWNKPDIDIFYSIPETIDANTKILFLLHGGSRTAEKYINEWLPIANDRNVVLIAPRFSAEFFPEYAYLMMSTKNGKLLKDQSMYLNNSLGLLFDFFRFKLKLSTSTYRLYGHSGGSHFIQRYLLLSQETNIEKAAMANAGFYTFVNDQISYPFGIKNLSLIHISEPTRPY